MQCKSCTITYGLNQEIGNISMNCFKDSELPHIGLSLSEGSCNTDQAKECLFEECSDAEACKYYYCRAEISEVGTLGLEFRALSAASGQYIYLPVLILSSFQFTQQVI